MNLILGVLCIIICFSSVVLIEKIFKSEGLYIWIVVATIVANIVVAKTININGIVFSLGNILFSSNFLASDILTEKYGKDKAKKGVVLGVLGSVIFISAIQLSLLFIPDTSDVIQTSMKELFTINLRVSIASLTFFLLSNYVDIYIYSKLKEKYPNKLWLRNNVSTITCNCLENYLFNMTALLGIYSFSTVMSISTLASIIEIILSVCDTPFLYLSKKLK